MAYVDPTADTFVTDFPEFEDRDPDVINRYIVIAQRMVDQSWTEGDYTRAIELYVAHLFTRSDLSVATSGGGGQIQNESLGPISVSYAQTNAAPGSDPLGLLSTTYGQEFNMLLFLNRGGARVT
jgi:hypothetical protein